MSGRIDRREFLRTAAGAALAAPAAAGCAARLRGGTDAGTRSAEDAARRVRPGPPNVLFLMTDEQHARSLSVTGNSYIETPHMDRLAREGALFRNATCVTPYCSPSRASILTGLYPHTHGILSNVNPKRTTQPPLDPAAFPNTETILRKHGYVTRHRGKWHLGDKGDFGCYESFTYAAKTGREYSDFLAKHLPAARFAPGRGVAADREPGRYLGRPVRKIPAVRRGWRVFNDIPNNRAGYIATIGRTVVPPELLPEAQITNHVIDLLQRHADRHADERFMITASWSPPHDLWVIPEPYYSMVDRSRIELRGTADLPAWDRRGASKRLGEIMGEDGIREYAAIYHGMVKYIDDEIGRVLAKLDELGLAESTLVVFTSDHGDMAGAHGCIGKSITSFFDDLVRIPLAMRYPAGIRRGAVVDEPVSQIDLMPTILDYVGLPIPQKIHGRSMRGLVEGRAVEGSGHAWRDHAFCQRAMKCRMLRTARYKYSFRAKPRMVALYDLEADPDEDRNLAGDAPHAAAVRRMHARLIEVMAADGDPLVEKLPRDPLA